MVDKELFMSEELINHCNHVRQLTEFLCDNLDITGKERICLLRAAEIHDIGKYYIPSEILNARRGLTKEERKIVNMHSMYGYKKCIEYDEDPLVSQLVLLHHGLLDNGVLRKPEDYMAICSIEAISLYPVLVASDIYSAMVTKRVYKDACTSDVALSVVSENKEVPNRVVKVLACM